MVRGRSTLALDVTKELRVKSLPPPEDTIDHDQAIELLRGWIVDGDLQVSLAFEAFGNQPEIWGQLLAETAVHIAAAMSAEGYGDRSLLFAKLKASLLANIESPHPGLHGTVRDPVQ
jgi:hypothetical protein